MLLCFTPYSVVFGWRADAVRAKKHVNNLFIIRWVLCAVTGCAVDLTQLYFPRIWEADKDS